MSWWLVLLVGPGGTLWPGQRVRLVQADSSEAALAEAWPRPPGRDDVLQAMVLQVQPPWWVVPVQVPAPSWLVQQAVAFDGR
jgi:hypothetical protein